LDGEFVGDAILLEACFKETNRRDVEELVVITERNPEAAVICRLELWNLGFCEFVPFIGLIRPVTSPFSLTPGVSDLANSLGFSICHLDFLHADQ